VVGRAPSLGEIFADAALVVDSRDETAVAAALDRVLGDGPLRARLVAAGHALAARHSWDDAARLTRAALLEAAGR
jgi:glycosyltransferase involved in cell wall biosynthesis